MIELLLLLASNIRDRNINEKKTPLFGFPIQFLALEKDLPNLMNWHVRSDQHSVRCMEKIFKIIKLEEELRQTNIEALQR